MNIFGSIGVFILLWFSGISRLWVLLYSITVFPLIMLSALFFLVRGFLDFWRLKSFVRKKVSQNYLVANFFQENKRLKKVALGLDKNNQSFNYDNGVYMVEKDTIWYDHDNHPNAFYLKNVPNPLKFAFSTGIKDFLKKFKSGNIDIAINDIAFSSQTLAMYKKDKIFEDLSRDPTQEKMLWGAGVIIIILAVVIGIMAVVR